MPGPEKNQGSDESFFTGPDRAFLMRLITSIPEMTRKQMRGWTTGPADQLKAVLAPLALSPVAFDSHDLPMLTTEEFSNQDRKIQKAEIERWAKQFVEFAVEASADEVQTVFSFLFVSPAEVGFKNKVPYDEFLREVLRRGTLEPLQFVPALTLMSRAEEFAGGSTKVLAGMTPFVHAVLGARKLDKGGLWGVEAFNVSPNHPIPVSTKVAFAAKQVRT